MSTETRGASWSIVVPTIGRPSLWALLDSLRRSSQVTGIALPRDRRRRRPAGALAEISTCRTRRGWPG